MQFDGLPLEIVALIGSYCAQADIVNLAVACPSVAEAIIPGLYQCIVIDPVPRSLYGAREWKEVVIDGKRLPWPASTVHTIAGIKQLLSTLMSKSDYASKVRSFTVKGNLAISDNMLIPLVRKAFHNMSRVAEFEWTACPELPLALIAEFPQCSSGTNAALQSLTVDLATRSNQVYPELRLPSLRKLHVRPFLNDRVLSWLRAVIDQARDVEELRLCRFLDSKDEIGSSFAFVGMSDVYQQHDPCSAVSVFFQNSPRYWNLKCLELVQIDTTKTDAATLAASVDLPRLETLTLVGSGQEDEFNHGLLACVVRAKPELKRAKLDWRASCSVTSEFLSTCCQKAQSLTITVKEHPQMVLDCLVSSCGALRSLEISMQCDFSLLDLLPLAKLRGVEILKIPFNHTVDSWRIVAKMPSLKVVNLVLKTPSAISSSNETMRSHGRPVNMGLLTSGILDQWNDQHRSPLQTITIMETLRQNKALEYVVIDGHVEALKVGAPSLESYEKC